MEYWSDGVMLDFFHPACRYSNTPFLHHSACIHELETDHKTKNE